MASPTSNPFKKCPTSIKKERERKKERKKKLKFPSDNHLICKPNTLMQSKSYFF